MKFRRLLGPLLLILVVGGLFGGLPCARAEEPVDRFERIEPAAAGFSDEGLAALAAYLEEHDSAAMLILHDGKVVFEWGDIHRKLTVHSIRKALLNSLYGIYEARGAIDLDATLAQLKIDDIEPALTDAEKRATVRDLLKSRSGVYHAAAAVSEGMLRGMPKRGSHAPDEAYYYNNWDFNALGTIFEKLTGKRIYEAFHQDVAKPLGMHFGGTFSTLEVKAGDEDIDIPQTDGFYQYERARSRHPAYHFRLSAHDLALYGQLYLDDGKWNGKSIVPADWIEMSTRAYSMINPQVGIGYGMLWRVLTVNEWRTTPSFFHTGAGVHMLGVYPGSRLVFVHRVDTESGTRFTSDNLIPMIDLIFAARTPTHPSN